MEPMEFIEEIHSDAMDVQEKTLIPASVLIAQSALETGWGKFVPRDMFTKEYSYNLFGIKATGDWDYVIHISPEVINGEKVMLESKFRKYASYEESIMDRNRLLLTERYKRLKMYSHDPKHYAFSLQLSGYATDPEYAVKISNIMERHDLIELCKPDRITWVKMVLQALIKTIRREIE